MTQSKLKQILMANCPPQHLAALFSTFADPTPTDRICALLHARWEECSELIALLSPLNSFEKFVTMRVMLRQLFLE
jgi:hypothetical protein